MMKELRLLVSGVLVALLIVACSGPGEAPQVSEWFTDADLDSAAVFSASTMDASTLGNAASIAQGPVLSDEDRGSDRTPLLPKLALDSSRTIGVASEDGEGLGGYVAYVEQDGDAYVLKLVDVNDRDSRNGGERVIYRGRRHIQSVAVSNDGRYVAFTAQSNAGDYDAYYLDLVEMRATFSDTRDADERDISLSLDGSVMVWQGGTPENPSIVWYSFTLNDGLELDAPTWEYFFGLPFVTVQPSVSGNGTSIALLETSGNLAAAIGQPPSQSIGSLDLVFSGSTLTSLGLNVYWLGTDLSNPSLSYDAGKLLLSENFAGVPYLTLIDLADSTITDVLAGISVDHPFLTADGDHAAFSFGGVAFLADLGAAEVVVATEDAGSPDSATYWARGNFTSYVASNDQGTFVRPGDSLSVEERTVGYHAFEFEASTDDYYSILSVQNFDGYLNLYVGSFDPNKPEENLIGANDDYLASWDDEAQLGRSRIVAELAQGESYVVVTSACGAPGSPCGPSTGVFTNTISDGATPPPPPQPPTVLPEPDNSGFNITLRFWNDSLTDVEKAIFEQASARWSEVITGDVENIPNINVPESATTTGAPGFIGELDDVVIDAAKVPIDGPSGVLARAGAYYVRDGGADDFLPFYGIMEFDEAEFGPGGFFENMDGFAETIMHEMGHVLGISRAFWVPLGYISGNPPADTGACSDVSLGDDPRYEGPAGNDAWVNDYNASNPKVPVANTGGCGTADSHWREIYLQDEIMTGYAQGGGEPLSLVTIGALQDLGYVVDFSVADMWSIPPLPTLEQVSPNQVSYDIEFDFTSAYTNSLLGEVTASITPVDLALGPDNASTSGCEADDFAGFPTGDIALVQRGTCSFEIKANNAFNAGAGGILIGNQGNAPDRMAPQPGTFGDAGVAIIGVPISYDLLVELATQDATADVQVRIDSDTSDNAVVLGPAALPSIDFHIAEELVPLRGKMDRDGNFTPLGGN